MLVRQQSRIISMSTIREERATSAQITSTYSYKWKQLNPLFHVLASTCQNYERNFFPNWSSSVKNKNQPSSGNVKLSSHNTQSGTVC